MKIGITGNTGFIGTHLTNYLQNKGFDIVPFEKEYFLYQDKLDSFVKKCDAIIHLAGQSKPHNKETVYIDNLSLSTKLYSTIQDMKFKGHLIFVSSIHESENNFYAKSKKKGREVLSLVKKTGAKFTGLILPNVFGSGANIEHSFVAAFCRQFFEGKSPNVWKDIKVGLIYIDELMLIFEDVIKIMEPIDYYEVRPTSGYKISEVLELLEGYNRGENYDVYIKNDSFQVNLLKTWKKDLATWQFLMNKN